MGNPRGVRRNAEQLKELERRRLVGAHLLRQGVSQAEVARRVGVHRQSVSRWAEQLQHGGRSALKSAGRTGRKPRDLLARNGFPVHYMELKDHDHDYYALSKCINADTWQFFKEYRIPDLKNRTQSSSIRAQGDSR